MPNARPAALSVRPKPAAITAATRLAGRVQSASWSAIRCPISSAVNSAVLVAIMTPTFPTTAFICTILSPGLAGCAGLDRDHGTAGFEAPVTQVTLVDAAPGRAGTNGPGLARPAGTPGFSGPL